MGRMPDVRQNIEDFRRLEEQARLAQEQERAKAEEERRKEAQREKEEAERQAQERIKPEAEKVSEKTVEAPQATKQAEQTVLPEQDKLYRAADGVKVVQENDSILVSFKFNREMRDCLTHIVPDAKLDTDKGVWVVPMEQENKVSMAVNQMRGIFRDTIAEEKALTAKALEKNYEAVCTKAFVKDGIRHQGTIVHLSERYVLVHEKWNLFKLHRRDALGETKENKFLEKGQRIDVVYEKGKAIPWRPVQTRTKELGRGLER